MASVLPAGSYFDQQRLALLEKQAPGFVILDFRYGWQSNTQEWLHNFCYVHVAAMAVRLVHCRFAVSIFTKHNRFFE